MHTLNTTPVNGFFLLAFLFSSSVFGADNNTQLDRIETKVGSVITTQEKILDVVDEEPLQGKNYGIEINPFRLLFIDKESKTLSGSFSFFNVKSHVEISIPFFVSISKDDNDWRDTGNFYAFTLDGHYRYFLGQRTKGFYISGFSRFAALHGTLGDDFDFLSNNNNNNRDSTYKLGVGFGIGYRVFSKRNFYWGASLNLGRYIIGDSNRYRSSISGFATDIDDLEYIIDVEFFKIGYAF